MPAVRHTADREALQRSGRPHDRRQSSAERGLGVSPRRRPVQPDLLPAVMPLSIVTASTTALREAALSLLFSPLPASQRDEQLASALDAARRHELSLDHLIVALDGDELVGAVLAVMRPGRATFLWPPVARPGSRTDEVSTGLLESIAAHVDGARSP